MKESAREPLTVPGKYMEPCEIPQYDFEIEPFTMVIFGGAGDLSRRKILPALYHLHTEATFLKDFTILATGSREFSDDQYKEVVKDALQRFTPDDYTEAEYIAFSEHLHYLSGDVKEEKFYATLCEKIDEVSHFESVVEPNILFYLAVPPGLFPTIVNCLNTSHLCKGIYTSKIIVEKPFGTNESSARELNRIMLKAFDETQIFRIDHYLGKETVQNILFFRFGNSIFEPLWDRHYIDHVQITVAESIGIEHRGVFYEQAGVVNDIVQNHIMQLMALVAMEPPVGFEANLIRDEKVKVFKTIRPVDTRSFDETFFRGQYGPGTVEGKPVAGYRQEEKVSEHSNTPTFFAGKFFIDNWRWADVPFYLFAGKRLPIRTSEIYVQFKQPPLRLLGRTCDVIEPNALIFSIQPEEEISLRLSVKRPGIVNQPQSVYMEFNYRKSFKAKAYSPYERLLIDCIKGDLTLFARQDGVEAMWRIVDPINEYWAANPSRDFPNYPAGTWGPPQAREFIAKDGRQWHVVDKTLPE